MVERAPQLSMGGWLRAACTLPAVCPRRRRLSMPAGGAVTVASACPAAAAHATVALTTCHARKRTHARCWDEYTRFKNCLIGKLNPDQQVAVLPGPHPLWHIRTRKEAGAFWRQHYAHLGAAATDSESSSGGTSGGSAQQPVVDEAQLRPDVTTVRI